MAHDDEYLTFTLTDRQARLFLQAIKECEEKYDNLLLTDGYLLDKGTVKAIERINHDRLTARLRLANQLETHRG